MKPAVLLTAKDYRRAKQRLARYLSPGERAALCRAMWEDVSAALGDSPWPVAVVTDSAEIAAEVRGRGWHLIPDNLGISESAAVDLASLELAEAGFEAVLRLPSDIPLVQTSDVSSLLEGLPHMPFARVVPSSDGTGTNALLRSPPNLFPARFGVNSLVLHLQEARRAGVEAEVVRNPRVAIDVDEEPDLRTLLRTGASTATIRLLVKMGLDRRLEEGIRA